MDSSPLHSSTWLAHTGSAQYLQLIARAEELAVSNGRTADDLSGADLAQARSELSGQNDTVSEIE